MQYLLRRLVLTVPVLLGVTIIVFTIMHVIPGDPVQLIFSGTGASLEQREAMRHALGLDRPLPVQYVIYVSNAIRGDLGQSIHFKQPVTELILERMPATIELTMASLFIALIVAFPVGIISAVKRNSAADHVAMTGATLGISLPTFWVGILLIMLVSVKLGWLPGFGRISYEANLEKVTGFHLIDSLLTWNIPAFKDALASPDLACYRLGDCRGHVHHAPGSIQHAGGHPQRLCGHCSKQGVIGVDNTQQPYAAQCPHSCDNTHWRDDWGAAGWRCGDGDYLCLARHRAACHSSD